MAGQLQHSFEALPTEQQQALHDELRAIARRYMRRENAGHTLQTTALVNEAYANLAGKVISVENKHHFIAILAQQMRRTLVDHARKKMAAKRENKPITMTLEAVASDKETNAVELIFLDRLLTNFAQLDMRSCQAFELKLFSSLSNEEISIVLGTSIATTERDLRAARAWLKTELAQV